MIPIVYAFPVDLPHPLLRKHLFNVELYFPIPWLRQLLVPLKIDCQLHVLALRKQQFVVGNLVGIGLMHFQSELQRFDEEDAGLQVLRENFWEVDVLFFHAAVFHQKEYYS